MASNMEGSQPDTNDRERLETLVAKASEGGVIEIVHAILKQALTEGASDVHFEPRRSGGVVRYRVAESLREAVSLPSELLVPILSRVKLMASLDVSEHRVPQQGVIHVQTARDGKSYDLQAATMPALWGESIVLHIVDRSPAAAWTWDILGMPAVETLQALLSRPEGLILFAGPAGSGRTTALYTALGSLDLERRNVVAAGEEAPFRIAGIGRSRTGFAVDEAVRALMERDTDVIAIGEVAGRNEVELALEAALAGHLVLTTFRASDALHALERLTAMDVPAPRLAAGLSGIVASRLVRRLCPDCKEAYQPAPEALRAVGMSKGQAAESVFYRGAGCDGCQDTGYRGRLGLYEVLAFDATASRLLTGGGAGNARLEGLCRHLVQRGFRSLREDGIRKVVQGLTTVDELLRAERIV